MKRWAYALFLIWLLLLAAFSLHSYPVPLIGGLALLRSLAWLGLLLGALLAFGRSILKRFHVYHASLSEEALYALALGSGASSAMLFIIGHFGGLYPVVAWLFVGLCWLSCFGHLEYFFIELRRSLRTKHPWEGSSTEMLALFAAAISLCCILALCLAPVSFYDALVYHLALPERAAALGLSQGLEGNLFSWLPGAAEKLWTLCILLDGPRLAALFNFSLALALALAVTDAAARHLPKAALWLPAALLLTQPLIALSFGVFGSDGIAAFFCFMSLTAFLRSISERNQHFNGSWLKLAALLAGMAVAVKPVALVHAALLLLLFSVHALRNDDERKPGLLLQLALLFLLPLLPWLLRNISQGGNPFQPFGLSLLGFEIFKPMSSVYMEHMRDFGSSIPAWQLPWTLSFGAKAGAFGGGGHLSFLFLGILPAALALGLTRELRWLGAYLLLAFVLWALGPRVLRYAIPVLPGLMILTAVVLSEVEAWARPKSLALVLRLFTVGALGLGAAHVFVLTLKDFDPFKVALGLQSSEDYLLAHQVNTARAASWLAARSPRAKLLLLGDSRSAGLPPRTVAATVFEAHPFRAMLDAAGTVQELDAILAQKGYDFALVNLSEWARIRSGSGAQYDYFSAPAKAALFEQWLKSHQGKGYSGEGVELFPLS